VQPLISKFAGEFAALAACTGVPVEQLMADDDYHSAESEHWLAWNGSAVVGALHPWPAPDGRLRLYFDACRADAYAPLCAVITGECFATVDGADDAALAALAAAGFVPSRTEREYEIPVARLEVPMPAGITFMTADHSELVPLMTLDCQIRATSLARTAGSQIPRGSARTPMTHRCSTRRRTRLRSRAATTSA
jgi:hypothetical protein